MYGVFKYTQDTTITAENQEKFGDELTIKIDTHLQYYSEMKYIGNNATGIKRCVGNEYEKMRGK